jgi:hypothetical protein
MAGNAAAARRATARTLGVSAPVESAAVESAAVESAAVERRTIGIDCVTVASADGSACSTPSPPSAGTSLVSR